MKEERNFYSVKEFHKLLGKGALSQATIYLKIKKGEIPVTYFGAKPLIPVEWVEAYCQSAKLQVNENGTAS
ncbi:MAG: hypothetical protein IJC05_00275 [Phascolarctobacterium sp.]|nr:hypothetical protein [Phascolarctobacterium sp.]